MSDQGEILLVEDNPNDVELVLVALSESRSPDEVYVTRDGEQALDYLHRRGAHLSRPTGNPKAVLLDPRLLILDGLEVLHRIKTDRNPKTMPVVMLASSREEQDPRSSYELGTNAYVVKPMGLQAFVEAIKEIGYLWGVLNQPPSFAEGKS